MNKERRVQHGVSNVSARSDHQQKVRKSPLANSSSSQNPPTEFHRSWTHKLISPDMYEPPVADRSKDRTISETATWRLVRVHERDFQTTQSASFRDPKTQKPPPEPHPKSLAEIDQEEQKKARELDAMTTMTKMAKKHFGTTAAMLKPFRKKKSGGELSFKDFNRYLERNNLSEFLTLEEQQHVFNCVDPHHKGKVPLMSLLSKAEEQEFLNHEHVEDMMKVRNFLLDHVQQRRVQKQEEEGSDGGGGNERRDVDLEQRKKTKAVHNERDRIATAIGQKTFDLDIGHDELNEVLRDFYHKLPTNEEHRKFARFLRFSNLDLSTIQFYDMRHEELENLKTRAVMIDKYLEDPEKLSRLHELSETRWNSSLATTNPDYYPPGLVERLNNPIVARTASSDALNQSGNGADSPFQRALLPKSDASFCQSESETGSAISQNEESRNRKVGMMLLSKSLPSLPVTARPSPLSHSQPQLNKPTAAATSVEASRESNEVRQPPLSPLSPSPRKLPQSQSEATLSGGRGDSSGRELLSPLNFNQSASVGALPKHKPVERARNLVKDSKGLAYEELSANKSSVAADNIGKASLDGNVRPALVQKNTRLKQDLFDNAPDASDFYAQVVDTEGHGSMGRVKDPTRVMRIEKIDPHAYMPSGKKVYHAGSTDWTRIGIGGDRDPSFVGYGSSNGSEEREDPFMTTNSKYYPPLRYEASKGASRDLISEAEVAFRKREKYRQERYARMQANVQVTQTRLQYDALEQDIRQMRRAHNRLEDRIRYHTSMFLNDLKCYKQQPLQRMARKQNINAAEKMWRGNQEPKNVVLVSEDRDFKSTYNTDFDSGILRDNEIINRGGE